MEPGQGRDVRAQDRAPLVGARECVLQDLLGGVGVASEPVGRPIDRRSIASEEFFERVQVIALHPAQ